MEQIAEIDGKALTQADADEKRKKASEIAAEAEQRRLDRQEEVNNRILEIQERLLKYQMKYMTLITISTNYRKIWSTII